MIKNIIFDLGKVLLDFNPPAYLKKKISCDKIDSVYEAIFKSNEWVQLDRGTITEKEAINNIIERNSELKEYILIAFDNWYEILEPIKENINTLKELKKRNYKIFFLSNFHELAFKYINDKYNFFDMFDGGIVSYKEKLLKPEAEIYQRLIVNYNIKPQESLFIDDTRENIVAARNLGMKGIVLESNVDLQSELRKYDINI